VIFSGRKGDGHGGVQRQSGAADAKSAENRRVDVERAVARCAQPTGQQIHRADEIGNEARARRLVDLAGRADLAQPAGLHDGDARGHRHRLALLCGWPWASAQEAKQPAKTEPAKSAPAKAPAAKAPPAKTAPKQGTDKAGLKTDSVEIPAPKTGARADFDKQMEDWKVILKKMRELRTNFQTAKDEEQKTLTIEFAAEVEKGRQMLPKLRDTALAAWLETGSADPQLERFLLKFVGDAVDQDNFEEGMAIAKKLLDAGSTEKLLPGAAGVCAYATNDYAAAEGYLKTANENGSLLAQDSEISKLALQFTPLVSMEKGLWEKELAIRKAEEAKDDLPPRQNDDKQRDHRAGTVRE